MQSLVAADIICVIFLLIILSGILKISNKTKSASAFLWLCLASIICSLLNAACVLLEYYQVNLVVSLVVYLLGYLIGVLALFSLVRYCYAYTIEKIAVSRWFFYIPMGACVVSFSYLLISAIIHGTDLVEAGVPTLSGGMPTVSALIQIAVFIYLPVMALIWHKRIGIKPFIMLSLFGILPTASTIFASVFGYVDYAYPACDIALLIMYMLIENNLAVKKEQEQMELLSEKNRMIEDNQQNLDVRYNIIKSMSSIYFASYYIDIENDSYIELNSEDVIRQTIKSLSNAQESLNIVCEKLVAPEYSQQMLEFCDLSTVSERLKDKGIISCRYTGLTSGWANAYLIAGDTDDKGNLKHLFFAARSIHEEKRKEDIQKRKLEEYNNIISNAGLGVWHIFLKEGDAPRMQANEKMRELLGIVKELDLSEEEIYSAWHDRIVPESLPSVEKSVAAMMKGRFSENTYLWNHPTKGDIYVRCGGNAHILEDGTYVLSGYHADVTDIVIAEEKQKSELALARQAAEAASAAKTSFLFNMSHDIRTPMNAIIGFTDLLGKNLDDKEKAVDYLSKIRASSNVLLSLINNVLEVARIESGRIVLDEMVLKADILINELKDMFSERMATKGIDFTTSYNCKTEYIFVDKVKTSQILLNIVSNAYKYTLPGGRVTIDISELESEREGYTIFETVVTDTGIGMSEEFLPHLFEQFSRAKTTTEDGIEGTGLGMPIVNSLVTLMGGSIDVKSELGKGTTFTVRLPHRIGSEDMLSRDVGKDVDREKFKGKRILLAEDNELNAEIAIAILNELSIEVDRAEDGIVCIDMLQKSEKGYYDLIFMDIQMPHMDGYKATHIIRSSNNDYMKNIPIIAMTANAFEEDKLNAISAGMNGHLAKPINLDELLSILADIMR